MAIAQQAGSSNECGGFRPPKGHLDTQMFPECEGTPTDRNIAKKHRKHKKKNKIASAPIEITQQPEICKSVYNLSKQLQKQAECNGLCNIEAKKKEDDKFHTWCKKRGFNGVCQSCITQAIDIGGMAAKMATSAIEKSKGKYHNPNKKK